MNLDSLLLWGGWATLASLAALLVLQASNTRLFRRPEVSQSQPSWPSVSLLVPARDEEEVIRRCVGSLAAQRYEGELEILVLDDGSTDATGSIVSQMAAIDSRIRLLEGQPLPPGWRGKNWACSQLARQAGGTVLYFTDADTLHEPDAVASSVSMLLEEDLDLLSLMPRQEAGSIAEKLTVPLLHFFFLTFFPAAVAARSRDPRFAAANGQLLVFRREAYQAIGGHESIRESVVDDLALARRIREEGRRVKMGNGDGVVSCRMYRTWQGIRDGFSKNLFAALGGSAGRAASVALMMVLLFVVPVIALATAPPMARFPWLIATICGLWLRLRSDLRGGGDPLFSLLHPISVLVAVYLLFRSMRLTRRGDVPWKGRTLER